MFNPFPGLRPFEADEDHLFFGREKEIDELLRRLRVCRFLAIIGTSGSGKSSLVRSGLIPSLYGGFMVNTNPSWRVAIVRPGEDPIRNLADSLNVPGVLGTTGELETTNGILLEATLRRGSRGLVEAVRQSSDISADSLLIVIDQFEELFRFRQNASPDDSRNDGIAFVKLLLEAAEQDSVPIYIVITMRSDFIGECMEFAGLPEAVNNGLYLVPRMTREELRSAITGPVAVGGGEIEQRLVLRLLNDFNDQYDQLPILQHALMRTWDYWTRRSPSTRAIDIEDYEAIGAASEALSRHAEEAYEETGSVEAKLVAERIFKALTDTVSDHRGIRRPTSIEDLTAVSESSESEVARIVDLFRKPGRSFLMPPPDIVLDQRSIIDLSHESLMRCWVRLATWAEEERASAEIYMRVSDAAKWYQEGRAGLWRNPELEVGEKWKLESKPTAAWARRYNNSFTDAISFLDQSEAERQRESDEKKRERQKKLRQTQWAAGILGCLLLLTLFLAYVAWRQTRRAQFNLVLAKKAVDESLSSAGSEQAREASDLPQVEILRKELLDKAQTFYTYFVQNNASDPALAIEEAKAHSRLGDVNRLMGRDKEAIQEYRESIDNLSVLAARYTALDDLSEALGYAHNWLGETIKDAQDRTFTSTLGTLADAEKQYTEAIRLQEDLHREHPANGLFQQELARTYYNRGIIRYRMQDGEEMRSDFRRAISLLEPLLHTPPPTSDQSYNPDPSQDLARVYNNYAIVLNDAGQVTESQTFYEKAIALAEALVQRRPDDRESIAELAQYTSNEAKMLADHDASELAEQRNSRALQLIEQLAEPTPSLSIRLVQSLQLKGELLITRDPQQARQLTDQAFSLLKKVDPEPPKDVDRLSPLYMDIGANYLELARNDLQHGNRSEARTTLANLTDILHHVSREDSEILTATYQKLSRELSRGPSGH